jgi:fatty acid synthase subunit beta
MRADLSKKINSAHLNPDLLVEKYIPNLIAEPFQVAKEYAQVIHDQTSSPSLDKVLKNWEQDNWGDPSLCQKLAYTILVELLAYQFASPVRWIETQVLLFSLQIRPFDRTRSWPNPHWHGNTDPQSQV